MKKQIIFTVVAASFAGAASAQSSVTLYGVVDAGLAAVSNQVANASQMKSGGSSMVGLTGGNIQGSRWGLRGAEDLGGGLKTIFTLESGFSVINGQQDTAGNLFNRQAFIGLTNEFGAVTLGRQYDSVVDYLGPLSATGTWGGTYFAHPGDNDNLNNTIRINNSVKFQSADYAGLSFSGVYGFSNQAGGFANNRAYSVGAGYKNGGLQLGTAYLQLQGLNSNSNGAVQGVPDYTLAQIPGMQNQRTWGVGGSYTFGPAVVGGVFTQSRFQDRIVDASVRYNNYEINGRYNLTPAFGLGVAYTFTQALNSTPAAGSDDNGSAHWNQLAIQADYALSARTDIYAESAAFLGSNGNIMPTQINGTSAPSSSRNQFLVSTGIRHRF
ncbi:MAG: porin [Paraburkholderia sp.]|uniref:porin n=1 Tax=Paraburkholderia sp. TaxID=1926495 RepID=UPI003C63DB01